MNQQVHPCRKILLVVTTGGFTHAAPVFEIGRVLAERGHEIEFATLEGQEVWVDDYSFISKLRLLGAGPTPAQLDSHYRRMQAWDISKGISQTMGSKYLFDSFWPQTYHRLKEIMDDPATRPDMIVADFFVDAVNDIHYEYKLPIAVVCPNVPAFQLPCPYIPGKPGFQLPGTMTSEDTSLWLRIMNEIFFLPDIPAIIRAAKWSKKMRVENGVFYPPHKPSKPDYLIFVNSFFGLEIPRDLPPTAAPVGPLLSPTYPPLDKECEGFFASHNAVLYIALGTHIIPPHEHAAKIVMAANRLLEDGLIDGVIWAMGETCRADLDKSASFQLHKTNQLTTLDSLLTNKHPHWLFPFFAPQRAILAHRSTKLYFTHGGGSSANEALYHGKPMLCMGIFADQIANTARLVAGGVAQAVSKLGFSSEEVYTKARDILTSGDGGYSRDVLRLQRIAHVASRRRYHAADLIEELVYDHELRFDKDGKELRPMHLQTADMRISAFKAGNWDLYAVGGLVVAAGVGSIWMAGRFLGMWLDGCCWTSWGW
ncbi:hypothetical protein BDV18DRAFT_155696 [Aspergillus unguis]